MTGIYPQTWKTCRDRPRRLAQGELIATETPRRQLVSFCCPRQLRPPREHAVLFTADRPFHSAISTTQAGGTDVGDSLLLSVYIQTTVAILELVLLYYVVGRLL